MAGTIAGATAGPMKAQDIVERCLDAGRPTSESDGLVVIVDEESTANLRWANNNLTTNGDTRSRAVTVVAAVGTGTGTASGVVSTSAVTQDDLESLVRRAEQAARDNGDADDAAPLVTPDETTARAGTWSNPPGETSPGVFASIAPALGDAFGRAQDDQRVLYGYVEHSVTTTYVGSTTGLRLRHEQPSGHIGITGKSDDRARSAWVGRSSPTLADVDITAMDAELAQRLEWAQRSVDLPAGAYDTVLPPSAVADLMMYMYASMSARDAHDGSSVFSRAGGGTKVGDTLATRPVQLWSDPAHEVLACAPAVVNHASSAMQSVFDTGIPLSRTDWIRDGKLERLIQTRQSARMTGLPVSPFVGNLGMTVDDGAGSTLDLVGDMERGLLLTCLWYIRDVDPQTLLLTGLTRDGVYLVENGEVTGAVNNFRFNESPVSLLGRFTGASAGEPTFGREMGDYFPRTTMPALRIPDFRMSSVSQAS